ncbi:MAG: hypothetical protein DMF69_23375, partial [Acidobacteria bacterium]
MVESKINRRSFVQAGLMSLLAVRSVVSFGKLRERKALEVVLEARVKNPGVETVSFGLPLPPGFLSDTRRVRVVDDSGQELAAAVRQLEPWRIGGRNGSIRSLLIQFSSDFSKQRAQKVKILFERQQKEVKAFVPVEKTLIAPDGLDGPRV